MNPLRTRALLAAAVLSAATAACATLQVHSFAESGSDLRRYRTYLWDSTADQLVTGDPRLDGNPFFHDRVLADVDRQLVYRGFEKAASDPPDMLLHYHASIREEINVNGADRKYTACTNCGPYVYQAGTLLIDIVDARTNRLVWRGWAEGAMDGVIDNQEWTERKIDDAVERVMSALPAINR